MSNGGLVPYNVSLGEQSALFIYSPQRDSAVDLGWNASYTGSTKWPTGLPPDVVGSGIPFRRTRVTGASASVNFDGTAVYLCISAGGAQYSFSVDGKAYTTTAPATDAACSATGADTILVAQGLPYGSHSAQLQITKFASADFRFFGGVVTLGLATGGYAPVESTLDDTDVGWTYMPPDGLLQWNPTAQGPGYYGGSATFNCNYDPSRTASHEFTGAVAVILRGPGTKDAHAFSVTLSGTTTALDMSGRWQTPPEVLFTQGGLDPAQTYTLTVQDYSSAQPGCPQTNSNFCCIWIDSLVLVKPGTVLVSPTPTPNATAPAQTGNNTTAPSAKAPGGAIAGAVVGAFTALGVGLLVVFLLLRRRRRLAAEETHLAAEPIDARAWNVHHSAPPTTNSPSVQSVPAATFSPSQSMSVSNGSAARMMLPLDEMPTAALLQALQRRAPPPPGSADAPPSYQQLTAPQAAAPSRRRKEG